ncbi:CorA family divalent cation transporter, partial [Klebsiella aerogenes]
FVITKDHLVTVRFHALRAFDEAKKQLTEGDGEKAGSVAVFLLLLEELVDSLADALEEAAGDLDSLSTRIFDFDASA